MFPRSFLFQEKHLQSSKCDSCDVALTSFSILQGSLTTAEPGCSITPLSFSLYYSYSDSHISEQSHYMSSFSTLLTKPPSSFLYKLLLSQTPPPPILRSCNLNFLDLSEKLVYSVKFHLVRFDLCSSPVKTSMNLGSAIHCDHYLSLFCVACKHGEQSSQ